MKSRINKWATVIIAVSFVVLVIMPLIRNDIGLARNPDNYMSKGWQEATQYLRNQLTPEQDALYLIPSNYTLVSNYDESKGFQWGEETLFNVKVIKAPIVLTWWDYGYWIVREAHMPVICSPGGGDRGGVARLLLSDNPYLVISQLKSLNIKYIVIDSQTAVEKFYAVVALAHLDLDEYYNVDKETGWIWRTQNYYTTLLARLYILDNETQLYWGSHLQFEDSPIRNYRIEGIDLVFQSSSQTFIEDGNTKHLIPEVKVFEVK